MRARVFNWYPPMVASWVPRRGSPHCQGRAGAHIVHALPVTEIHFTSGPGPDFVLRDVWGKHNLFHAYFKEQ